MVVSWITVISVALSLFSLRAEVLAEDVGAIVAAFNDPTAECQYLVQKTQVQNHAITLFRKVLNQYVLAMRAAAAIKKDGKNFAEMMKYVEQFEQLTNAAGDISSQAQAEVRIVTGIIQAKRGSVSQCAREIAKIPPPEDPQLPP